MYTLKNKKTGSVTLSKDGSVIIEDKIKDKTIKVEINGIEIKNIPNMKDIFSIDRLVNDLMFIAYNYSENTVFYDKTTLSKCFQLDVKLLMGDISEDDIYIYVYYGDIIYKYNKQKNNITQIGLQNCRYCYCFFDTTIVYTEEDNIVHLCQILQGTIKSIWRINAFNDLFPGYKRKDEFDRYFRVSQIKVYNGDFIVATTGGIARLDAKTGETIWKTECRYSSSVEVVGNIGYVGRRGALCKIDLDNGMLSGYGWENDLLPRIEYAGRKYWAHGGDIVYNDGLLWHSVNMSGKSFVVAIDPKDGSYVWVERVDSEHIYEPQFHQDKMYISDISGNLFIYQKDSTEC